jgi:membrane-associated phospholipid phosphatase
VLTPTAKIIPEMWVHLGLRSGAAVFSGASNVANPVAAIPSLHSAYPMLIVLFFWKPAGKYRWLLLLYPLAMGFTLVYAAEHYVGDVLLGWLYAVVVYFVGSWALDKWEARRAARKASPPLTAVHVT